MMTVRNAFGGRIPLLFAVAATALPALAGCGHAVSAQIGNDSAQGGSVATDVTPTAPWHVSRPITDHPLRVVAGVGNDIYVAGDSGSIFKSVTNGETWSNVSYGALVNDAFPEMLSISGSGSDVWAAGGTIYEHGSSLVFSGLLVHSSDAGQSWQPQDISVTGNPLAVWAIDRDHVVVGGDSGIVSLGDADGHFTQVFSDPSLSIADVWAAGLDDMYAVANIPSGNAGGDSGVPDAGSDWIYDTHQQDFSGLVLHSSDGGISWQTVVSGAPCGLSRLSGTADGGTVYAVGPCATVASTTNHGASWSVSGAVGLADSSNLETQLADVWVAPTGQPDILTPFAVVHEVNAEQAPGPQSSVALSVGGEELLPSSDGNVSYSGASIWGRSIDDVWVVGGPGYIWHKHW